MSRVYKLRARSHTAYVAFVIHRISGVALALFLPMHFLVLARALQGEAALDGALAWIDNPLLKVAEVGLVLALALHLAGGLRLLALETLAWRNWQKNLAALGAGASVLVGLAFALQVF